MLLIHNLVNRNFLYLTDRISDDVRHFSAFINGVMLGMPMVFSAPLLSEYGITFHVNEHTIKQSDAVPDVDSVVQRIVDLHRLIVDSLDVLGLAATQGQSQQHEYERKLFHRIVSVIFSFLLFAGMNNVLIKLRHVACELMSFPTILFWPTRIQPRESSAVVPG